MELFHHLITLTALLEFKMICWVSCFHLSPEGYEDNMQLGEYRIKYILLCLVGYPAVGPLSILKIQQAILSGILLHSRWRRGGGAPASAGGGWRWAAMEGRSQSEGVPFSVL